MKSFIFLAVTYEPKICNDNKANQRNDDSMSNAKMNGNQSHDRSN